MHGSEVQELGHLLREARERKGVTLADAQQATKIRLSFLQALEKEDFSVLPPPFYIRGFIKTYAVYLNLDPRSTVQLFDDVLDNNNSARLAEQQAAPPSADSGGRALIPLEGLSQAEADIVANSNERLNLRALPAPGQTTLVSGQRRSTGYTQIFDDNPVDGFGAGYSTRKSGGTLGQQSDKYVLKQVMLPTARGAFYMPNFIPTILVIIIVLAAGLLIYRGISNKPQETTQQVADVTATVAAGGYPGPYAITPDPTISSARATMTAGDSSSSVMKPPAFFTPDASVQALDRTPGSGTTAGSTTSASTTPAAGTTNATANQPANSKAPVNQPVTTQAPPPPAPTATPEPPAPTATPTPPPTATPIPDPITAVISIADTDPKGSWIRITVDDKVVVEKVGAPNESFTYTGMKVAVRAGNPGLIRVSINGESKVFVQPNGGVITHTWFAGGKDTVE